MNPDAAHALRFLALGDSYTIGEGVDPAACWPQQLARALRARGLPIAAAQIVAATGWTTDELASALDKSVLDPPYALVSLLIGVNNQYRGRSVDEYRTQFSALLERAIVLAGARADRVLVLSIPDWGVTPFARDSGRDRVQIARALDGFNAAALAICAARGVAFVDITPLSREPGAQPGQLTDDGLHPSAAQYAQWTGAMLASAERLLQR